MPTTAQFSFTLVRLEPAKAPNLAVPDAVKIAPSTTLSKGAILGEITASPGVYNAYNHANTDGTQVPKCILAVDVVTDSAGNPTNLTYPYPAWPDITVPVWIGGYFRTNDMIPGTSAAEIAQAIAAGFGKLVEGTTTVGVLEI